MRSLILSTALCLSLAAPALAMKEPDAGKLDKGMVTAEYEPGQVYDVAIPQGKTFAVSVGKDESVTDAFGADKTQLVADVSGNVLILTSGETPVKRPIFVRSSLPDGSTRTYPLMVRTVAPETAPIALTFTYKPQATPEQIAAWKAAQAKKKEKEAIALMTANARGENDSNPKYVLRGETAGDWDLLPTKHVSDNGRETHFWFPGNMEVPIIYIEDDNGHPALADYSFNSATGIATVHQLARVFLLRKGDSLLTVYNKAYDPVGLASPTNTISPEVTRVLKD